MQSLIHPIENLPRTSRALERLLAGIAAGDRNALTQLYHRTRTAVYASALAVLKNAHDAVLLHAAGFKHREIAHRLGIPLATVLSRHHRALKKLKQMIEGDDRS